MKTISQYKLFLYPLAFLIVSILNSAVWAAERNVTNEENNLLTLSESSLTGSLFRVLESSSDSFYLWDSEPGLVKGLNGQTRHVRVRIEESQLNQVRNFLNSGVVHANGYSLTPKAEIKRDAVRIAISDDKYISLYPYAENAVQLVDAFQELFVGNTVGITKKGLIYIIDGESIIYGYLDYYITKPAQLKFGDFSFSEVFQENGFDTILITYPSGTQQKMYFFKVEISTI